MKPILKGSSLLAFILLVSGAQACIWIHGTTLDGFFGDFSILTPGYASQLEAVIKKVPLQEPKLFQSHAYTPDDPVAKANDKAVQTLLSGDAKKAVKMLEKIEADFPGQYYTAANLGTAYELAGDDKSALEWIVRGIERNPESHMQTEWLHARILETKIKLKSDPEWLKTHTITEADFSQLRRDSYFLETRQKRLKGREIHMSIFRQLLVRMLFVKPKDTIVAQLMKELALCEAQLGILENADSYARLAVLYGASVDELKDSVLSGGRSCNTRNLRILHSLSPNKLRHHNTQTKHFAESPAKSLRILHLQQH